MNAIPIAVIVAASAASSVSGSARGRELGGLDQQHGPVRIISSAASPTVLSTLVSRDGQLVLLVLWRGSSSWLARGGGRASSQGGGSGNQTWVQLTRGELTLSVDVDHVSGVAHVLKQTASMKNKNVVLVAAVDTTPVVQTAQVDSAVLDGPDAVFAVLRREPSLLVFLQCDLMRAVHSLTGLLVNHPCAP